MRRFVPLIAVVTVLLTSCGGTIGGDTTGTSAPRPTDPSTAQSVSPTTTQAPAIASDSADSATTSLVGGPIDFGPHKGDVLAVVGVSHDDILNLRAGPGPDQQILDTIDPTYATLVAQGKTWDTSEAFWIEVDYEGTSGWVHFGYVAYLGYTDDVTATVVANLDDDQVAATMEELGLLVSEVFESRDPPSRIVMAAKPTLADYGEVIYDVIGLGDDAEYGVRLHVLGESTADGFALKAVELTSLCGRGVSDEQLCV